jgi:hypothetical protein
MEFEAMSKLVKSQEGQFGGAYVIYPPEGTAISALVISTAPDPAEFWANLKTRCEVALNELAMKEHKQGPFGRR